MQRFTRFQAAIFRYDASHSCTSRARAVPHKFAAAHPFPALENRTAGSKRSRVSSFMKGGFAPNSTNFYGRHSTLSTITIRTTRHKGQRRKSAQGGPAPTKARTSPSQTTTNACTELKRATQQVHKQETEHKNKPGPHSGEGLFLTVHPRPLPAPHSCRCAREAALQRTPYWHQKITAQQHSADAAALTWLSDGGYFEARHCGPA